MKKIIVLLLICLTLVACGKKEEVVEEPEIITGVANPVHESDKVELNSLGYEFYVPEGAKDLAYSYIDSADSDVKLAQIDFTLNDVQYCYRQKLSSLTEATDISGDYNKYANEKALEVGYCDATIRYDENGPAVLTWFDVVVGIDYSLTMNTKCNIEDMMNVVNQIYVPLQGDAK